MRVIGGAYRGKKLLAPPDNGVRPTSDRAKEALFNILQFAVPGRRVLDLFAGSGALGIEAASRGAAEVTFVDKEPGLVKRNLALVGLNARVVAGDAEAAVADLARRGERFGLVFLDPPYRTELAKTTLEAIARCGLLEPDGIAVSETLYPNACEAAGLTAYDSRKYGKSLLTFYRREE